VPGTFARTSLSGPVAWAATLDIRPLNGIPCDSVTCGALGGSATISHLASFTATVSPAVITWVSGEDSVETRAAAQTWVDLHGNNPTWIRSGVIWERKVAAPGMMNSDRDLTVVGQWPSGTVPPLPMTYSWEGVDALTLSASCVVSDLVLCRKRVAVAASGRQVPLDHTDCEVSDTWFAGDGAAVVVTGGGLSISGALSGAGAEVNLGTAFNFVGSILNNEFPAANTSYGKISSITCFGQSLSMGVVLYNPGNGAVPSAAYPDWHRAAPDSGAYLLLKDDGADHAELQGAVRAAV
jgi:hypothetical protein